MLSFCILYLRFLKWNQAQTRNPLQRRSDFIYIETLSTNTYNVQRVGGPWERERSCHTPHSSSFHFRHSRLNTLYHSTPFRSLGFTGTGPGRSIYTKNSVLRQTKIDTQIQIRNCSGLQEISGRCDD